MNCSYLRIIAGRGAALALAAFALAGVFSAQQAPPPKAPVNIAGETKDGVYSNEFFGMYLRFPKDFIALDANQTKIYDNAGADIIKNNDDRASKRIDAALNRQTILLSVLRRPMGSADNATFEAIAVKQSPTVTANIALAASVGLMTASGKYKLVRPLTGKFGGRTFPRALLESDIGTLHVTEEMYAVILNGYGIVFGITYWTEDGKRDMQAVLNSLEFAKK